MRTHQMKTSENSPTKRTIIQKKSTTFADERTERVRCEEFINRVTTLCYSLKLNIAVERQKTLIQNKMPLGICR